MTRLKRQFHGHGFGCVVLCNVNLIEYVSEKKVSLHQPAYHQFPKEPFDTDHTLLQTHLCGAFFLKADEHFVTFPGRSGHRARSGGHYRCTDVFSNRACFSGSGLSGQNGWPKNGCFGVKNEPFRRDIGPLKSLIVVKSHRTLDKQGHRHIVVYCAHTSSQRSLAWIV